MAKIFESTGVVSAWLDAAKWLNSKNPHEDFNLVLEISNPLAITSDERIVMDRVDLALRSNNTDLTLETVAGTIFPLALYRRYGRPDFYDKYIDVITRGKKLGTWGTYAARIIRKKSADGSKNIYPLEMIIERLRSQPKKGTDGASNFTSAYELGVADPESDLQDCTGNEGDIPTYNCETDGKRWMGLPCLSHLSFKRIESENGPVVNMVAIYRSHYYCARALGNLIGLAQLLQFVAKEANLSAGKLTCISTYAALDVAAWGGKKRAEDVLKI